MLYPDSDRRIAEINRIASLFGDKGYVKTASEITRFADMLKQETVPPDFLERLDQLFDVLEIEFSERFPLGKDYRRRCYAEVKKLLFEAIGRMKQSFSQGILEIYPCLAKINHGRHINGDIADEIRDRKLNDKIVFHLFCYAYLITVEGIFDELARVLYFLKVVKQSEIPKAEDLKRLKVRDILERFRSVPVFLENWEEKNHIRNAIAHATAYFDSSKKEARFVDEPSRYDKTMSLDQFAQMALELEDSTAAFSYIMLLLKLYDFIQAENPFQ